MTINDFILSCATDDVPGYFTYEGENMLIVQSKEGAKNNRNDFEKILVITHIEELRDAFPARIDVVKTANGSMISLN